MIRRSLVVVLSLLAAPIGLSGRQDQKPAQERPPVFRAGAHFVRVDAYPSRDGRIVRGLTAGDFELFEDGTPQTIDTFQFVAFDAFTTDEERRDPNSQRDAFALAADPAYRVFVLYLDAYHVGLIGSHNLRQPLVGMLERILGPRDLFGLLTPRQSPKDLILGRQTLMIDEQLSNWTWGLQGQIDREPEELMLQACGLEALIPRRRLDKVFSDLEGLVTLLGSLRQERSNILVFSRGWVLPGPDEALRGSAPRYIGPPVGITDAGKITLGTSAPGAPNERACQDALQRLSTIDFRQRHRDLMRQARETNVTFYAVNPTGLEAAYTAAGMDAINERNDRLLELAHNTDGEAVINSNDLTPGLNRISSDLSAYYVLGYYTTNTKWDGGIRKITVRLKGSKDSIRARREYRAPTDAEMASMRAVMSRSGTPAPSGPTPEDALAQLTRIRPASVLLAHGAARGNEVVVAAELAAPAVEAGRWAGGGDVAVIVTGAGGEDAGTVSGRIEAGARGTVIHVPVSSAGPWTAAVRLRASGEEEQFDRITIPVNAGLVGEPLAYRATPAPRSPLRPVGVFQFRRTERIHVEWPVLRPLDRRDARLLGKDGRPLALDVTVGERDDDGRRVLAVDLNLAPLTAGDYVIEVTAAAGETSDRKLVALRIVR